MMFPFAVVVWIGTAADHRRIESQDAEDSAAAKVVVDAAPGLSKAEVFTIADTQLPEHRPASVGLVGQI